MNLLVSYDWLKEYVGLKETPEEFASRVSLSGPGIERLYPQGGELEGILVGCVLEVKPHPNADKLRVAKVDIGSKKLSIVCGGSNLQPDQWVAVATIGSKVKWHGEGELVTLKPTEIRGVKSEGMICAANEIGLFDAFPHLEREILDLGQRLLEEEMKPGMPLAEALKMDGDVVMDTEVTTNRPDAMGIVGIAREASAILKRPFLWKPPKRITPPSPPYLKGRLGGVNVRIEDKKLCPRFMAVRMEGVKVGPSPWWMKRRLISAGVRPINNLVDITNYVMLELGRPMHVFDADTLKGDLRVRMAKKGEVIKALDGKTYELKPTHLVVADENGPQSIAGIMGGEDSGVTEQTRNIIFECAVWDPVQIRRTARDLYLMSDAQSLFEKGLSTESTLDGLARSVELAMELAGGSVASSVYDSETTKYKSLEFSISFEEVDSLIGVEIPKKDMLDTLKRLGFGLKANSSKFTAVVPWWRDHDIESGRDLVEEIARVYGYANLPAVFPVGLSPHAPSKELMWEDRLKTVAKGAGLTELYTYSFVSDALMKKADFDSGNMLKVQNELSSDFVYMRTALLPSILQVVEENQGRFPEQKLFEIAHVYFPRKGDLPDERLSLAAAFFGHDQVWREAKGFAELIYQEVGMENVEWKPLEEDDFWHPGRTVQAFVGEHLLGTIGELHPQMVERFGLDGRVALVDMAVEEIIELASTTKRYVPVPQFPEAKRDLALLVNRNISVQDLSARMKEASAFLAQVEWFDTYKGDGVPADKKSVAFHLTFLSLDRTLETKEVDQEMEKLAQVIKKEFGGIIRA